ncbi:hypothetical protein Patl1_10882 [Pistacia atlantica]|uniref:Uncharacterized protein n=1 Tax=Pistacia atlantica TaxID=434234 RepID=A0ACC1A9K4_9ROSI|nr:hypothetical protein Patl1_10882 [Pistacia atlantica]
MEALTWLRQTTTVEAYKSQFEFMVRMLKPSTLTMAFSLAKMQEENVAAFQRGSGSVQRLSSLQMKERRAKGLCYKCDDKWGSCHKCKFARLFFIMDCAYSEEDEPQPVQQPPLLEGVEVPSGGEEVDPELAPEISIHALAGSPSPKTMCILGHVNGCVIVILIDTGSTHNFMDPSIQLRVHLPSQSTSGLLVRVAN